MTSLNIEKKLNIYRYPTFRRKLLLRAIRMKLSSRGLILLIVLRFAANDFKGSRNGWIDTTEKEVCKLLDWSEGSIHGAFNEILKKGLIKRIKKGRYYITNKTISNPQPLEDFRHKYRKNHKGKEDSQSAEDNSRQDENDSQLNEDFSFDSKAYKGKEGEKSLMELKKEIEEELEKQRREERKRVVVDSHGQNTTDWAFIDKFREKPIEEKTNADYQKIIKELGFTKLTIEDLRWADANIKEENGVPS